MKKLTDLEKLNFAIQDFKEYLSHIQVPSTDRSKIEGMIDRVMNHCKTQEIQLAQKTSQEEFLKSQVQLARTELKEVKEDNRTSKREQDLVELVKDSRVFFSKLKYPYMVSKDGNNLTEWFQRSNEILSNYDEKATNYTPLKRVA